MPGTWLIWLFEGFPETSASLGVCVLSVFDKTGSQNSSEAESHVVLCIFYSCPTFNERLE